MKPLRCWVGRHSWVEEATADGRARYLLLVAALAAVAMAGCDSSEPSSAPSSGGSEHSPAPSAKVGDCRTMPAVAVMDYSDWADDSPVVDCSRPHTLETVAVFSPVEHTRKVAEDFSTDCRASFVSYVGVQAGSIPAPDFPLQGRLFLPTREQVHKGQKWVRCDIALAADTHWTRAAEITGSIEGALGTNPAAYWLCLQDLPKPDQNQPYTSCLKPHRTEVTPSDAVLTGLDAYPSKATLAKEGRSYCDHFLAHRPDGDELSAAPVWASNDQWDGQTLYGGCWFWRKDGTSLPPMG